MTAPGTQPFPGRVGVLGGGRMGSGIAHAFLVKGAEVVIVDVDESATRAAGEQVTRSVRRSGERGALDGDPASVLVHLETSSDVCALAGCDLVVEAVPEDVALKQRLLGTVVVGPEAVVASNTSSLSISGLAAYAPDARRFLGLHFFNPVPSSELVEIVVGEVTEPDVVTAAQEWVVALGKTPVTVADTPGFATSRLGLALGLEAVRMLEEGVAPAEEIDAAMVLGYKHPIGPLRLTDLVGLDVRLGVADHLTDELGPRFAAPQLLRDKVAAGELGRKTGRGFYKW